MRPHPRHRQGQSTVEFALISPLIVLFLYFIVATTSICLQLLRMNDVARNAARVAATSKDASTAVAEIIEPYGYSATISNSSDDRFVTVTIRRVFQPFAIGQWISPVPLHAAASMMREPPMVLE